MSRALSLVRWLGFAALAIFLVMAAVLKFQVGPNVQFLPQAEFGSYSDLALVQFADDLRDNGLDRFYANILLIVDFIFITVFGLWVMLVHMMRSSVLWRFWGVGLAALFMVLDFSENMMLAVRMGFATKGNLDLATFTPDVSAVHSITLAKYAVFALCCISAFIASRKRG